LRLAWSRLALADRDEIFSFTELRNARLAVDNDERILACAHRLRTFAGIGRIGRVLGTRELVVEGTQFILVYQVDGEVLTVLRLLHSAQRWPGSVD
jgi:toxin ParE1/3/4